MIRFEMDGNRFRAVLMGKAAQISRVDELLMDIGMLERDLAVERIKMGGDPPWPPSQKVLHGVGQTGVDQGTMMRAISANTAVTLEDAHTVRVGVNVRTPDGKYNYAKLFQEGSGIYAGHTSWTIEGHPVLSWMVGGVRVYSRRVTIQGQPPRPFLYWQGSEDKVKAIVQAFVRRALRGTA